MYSVFMPASVSPPQNVLAKALYDNVAESPDELSFRKGDIMTVLERDTQGLDGWWLCSLHGRQGIVPGNRLKILVGMYDSKQQQQGPPLTPDPAATCPTSQVQRALPPQSAYAKPALAPLPAAVATSSSGLAIKPLPAAQYTSMHPAYSTPGSAQSNLDSVYMMPPSHSPRPSPQSLYQVPSGPVGPTPQAQPGPPSKAPLLAQRQYQLPVQDIYQVPPSVGPGPGQGVPAGGTGTGQDVYQVPPSLEKRTWDSTNKPLGKVRERELMLWRNIRSDLRTVLCVHRPVAPPCDDSRVLSLKLAWRAAIYVSLSVRHFCGCVLWRAYTLSWGLLLKLPLLWDQLLC